MKQIYKTLRTFRKSIFLLLAAGLFMLVSAGGYGQATVTTDKLDYAPGETVQITGTGFGANETVLLLIEHIEPNLPDPPHLHDSWEVIADENGDFLTSWYVDDPELNTTLLLTAIGQTSGLSAETVFTDADKHDIYFETSGLPAGTSVTVTWSGTSNNGQPFSGSTLFSSPGPTGSSDKVSTQAGTSFTFSFPTITGYDLINTNPTSPYTTGAKNEQTTILATYAPTCTPVSITSATAAASPICPDATTTLTANGVAGTNAVVTWWTGSGGTGSNLGTGLTTSQGPGTYYARVTGDCGTPVEAMVTVDAKTLPEITVCPGNVTEDADPDKCETQVTFGPATATGSEPVSIAYYLNFGEPGVVETESGDIFQVGVYTVTAVASNACGSDECTFTITVEDNQAPVLVDPATDCSSLDETEIDACLTTAEEFDPETLEDDVAALYEDNCGGEITVTYTGTTVPEDPDPLNDNCDWTFTYEFTIEDSEGNETSCSVTYSGGDDTDPVVITKDITVSLESDGTVTIDDNAVDDGSYDSCDETPTFSLTPKIFDCEDLGEKEVTLTVTDECENSASETATVTIVSPTVTTALVSAEAARYWDEVTLYAEIESYCGIDDLTGTVEFFLDGISVGTAPAYPIPEGEPGYPDKLRATLIHHITQIPKTDYETEPWIVTAEFTSTTSYYLDSDGETELLIYPREADPFAATGGFYTGTILAWTTGPNSSTGTITMATLIKDNNEPTGDLRGAKVTFCFVEGGILKPIPGAKDLPVSLVDMTDGTIGAASADVQVDIGKSQALPFQIAVMITGGYENNPLDTESQAMVTVAKPVPGGTIFGGGNLINKNSGGQIKGAYGHLTEFEFDVQYNKKQTNPQGKMSILLRSYYKPDGTLDDEMHTYLINSNAINLFVMGPITKGEYVLTEKQAIFDAKANLSEMLDDGTIVPIDGNSPLHVTMTDNFTPPSTTSNVEENEVQGVPVEIDSIAITYYNSEGGIWYSSHFSTGGYETTIEQRINDGDIEVASEVASQSTGGSPSRKSAEISITPTIDQAALRVYPNPFSNKLRFEFESPESTHVSIDMYDMTGRMIRKVFDNAVESGVTYQADFTPETTVSGMYFYRMTMGEATFNGKVIFTP